MNRSVGLKYKCKLDTQKEFGIFLSTSAYFIMHSEVAAQKVYDALAILIPIFPRKQKYYQFLYCIYVGPLPEYAKRIGLLRPRKKCHNIETYLKQRK